MSRSRRVVGWIALVVAVGGAAYFAVRAHLGRGVVEFGQQAAVVARQLRDTTDSVSTSAVDQRYRMRRDAVAAMRFDLTQLVSLESTLVADSGLPRAFFSPYSQAKYRFFMTAGNVLNRITLEDTGWTASIASLRTTVVCSIHVPYVIDTAARPPRVILSHAPPQPVCTQPR